MWISRWGIYITKNRTLPCLATTMFYYWSFIESSAAARIQIRKSRQIWIETCRCLFQHIHSMCTKSFYLIYFFSLVSFIVCMEWKIELALRITLLFLCVVQCTLGKSIQNQRYYLQSRRSIPCRQQTTSNRMINKEQNTNWHW